MSLEHDHTQPCLELVTGALLMVSSPGTHFHGHEHAHTRHTHLPYGVPPQHKPQTCPCTAVYTPPHTHKHRANGCPLHNLALFTHLPTVQPTPAPAHN